MSQVIPYPLLLTQAKLVSDVIQEATCQPIGLGKLRVIRQGLFACQTTKNRASNAIIILFPALDKRLFKVIV